MKKLFSKNFNLMFSSNFVLCVGFYVLLPVLPAYGVKGLGIDNGSVGVIVGIFSLAAIVSRPIAGLLLDRNNKMFIYIPMLILFFASFGFYIYASAVWSLVLVRLLHGISWGGVSTSTSAIVADIIPQSKRGAGMGYFGLSMTLGMALGPAIGVHFMELFSYTSIFLFCMALGVVALISSFLVKLPDAPRSEEKWSLLSILESKVFGISSMQFFFGVSYISILIFVALLGIERGITNMGLFFVIFAVAIAITRPIAGKIMDKHGPTYLIIVGFLMVIISLLILSVSYTLPSFLLAGVLSGLGSGFLMPAFITMVINIVKPERRGSATATLFIALDLGIGVGSIGLGYLSNYLGYGGMYVVASVITAVPLIMYLLIIKNSYYKAVMEQTGGVNP